MCCVGTICRRFLPIKSETCCDDSGYRLGGTPPNAGRDGEEGEVRIEDGGVCGRKTCGDATLRAEARP